MPDIYPFGSASRSRCVEHRAAARWVSQVAGIKNSYGCMKVAEIRYFAANREAGEKFSIFFGGEFCGCFVFRFGDKNFGVRVVYDVGNFLFG